MKPFYGFTEEDLKRSDNIQFFMDTTDTSDEEEERTPKKAKVEEGKPYAVKSSPPPISTVPELFEAVEAKRETPSPSTDLPSSPPHHYLIAIYKDGDAVPIENPTFEDLRQAFPCAMSNLPPPPPPPSPPSVVKEESNTIIRKINPAFVEKHQCFYRGKENFRVTQINNLKFLVNFFAELKEDLHCFARMYETNFFCVCVCVFRAFSFFLACSDIGHLVYL